MADTVVRATVTELPESRVRVEAEVPSTEVERSLDRAARQLGRDLRIPGFRKGKVPTPVVIQRIGREAVLDEAVRGFLPQWYIDAVDAAGIAPVGEPSLDVGDLPGRGEPLTFSIEVGVRPKAQLGDYKDLEVGRAEPEADDAAVDREIDTLRDRLARLEAVERAAEEGDFLTVDYLGTIDGEAFAGGEGRDQLIELGAGRLIPGFEDQLKGANAGDDVTVKVTFPDDYGAEHLAGKDAEFAVSVKEIKAKQLPEVDDDLAEEAGFDTIAELREDISTRLREVEERRIAADFREAALDAAVAAATIEVPDALIDARAGELWDRMLHSLSHQGIDRDAYLRIAGRTEEDLLAEARPDAEQQLRREAVVAAIIEAEGIETSDDEVLEALAPAAQREGSTPKKMLEQLRSSGRLDDVREEVLARKAIDLVADSAKPIALEQAAAREQIWTPESEETSEKPSELWTPGS
ncbi:MAG: trigger factor [Solirubrobacteraceae bacterium]|jgi:trigger factor|nr:trigger factor [Solirubrobacteraceae bacterium]